MISQVQVGFYNSIKLYPETWASLTAYPLGDFVKASTYASKTYLVTTAGTTASVEPTWSTTEGATVSSGACIFTVKDMKCYNTIAPQTASVPYVTFGLLTESPIGDFADFEAIENLTFWVNCFSNKGITDVCEIADEVMDALDGASITASGFTSLKCIREFISQPTFDDTTRIYQTSLRYRAWFDKT